MTDKQQTTVCVVYVVEAECADERGELVWRSLGMVRGITDSGQPGWTKWGPTEFPTKDAADEAARSPYSYSVYDGHYKGGALRITEVTTRATVETETFCCSIIPGARECIHG